MLDSDESAVLDIDESAVLDIDESAVLHGSDTYNILSETAS